MGFTDPYGTDSPFVVYTHPDTGAQIPILRSSIGGIPLLGTPTGADEPPTIEMPAEDVPAAPPTIEMPAETVPPRAPDRVPLLPGQGLGAQAQQQMQAAKVAKLSQTAPGVPAPEVDAVSGADALAKPSDVQPGVTPSGQGVTLPGVGYVPNADVVPQPGSEAALAAMTPEEQALFGHTQVAKEKADAELASANRAAVDRQNAEFLAQKEREYDTAQATSAAKKYQDTVDKLAKTKIDPNRKWHDLGTGKQIGAIMFALVSGIGSALKHQGDKNPALDMILASIDRDVSLQMAERDKLAGDVARRRDAYDMLRTVAGDREAERQGRISAIANRQADEFDAIGRNAQSKDVAYQYLDMANQLRAAGDAAGAAAAQREFENQLAIRKDAREQSKNDAEVAKIRSKLGGGGGGGIGAGGQYTGLSDDQVNSLKRGDRERAVRLADGSWVLTKSKDAATKADALLSDSRVMVQNIDRVIEKMQSGIDTWQKLENKSGWQNDDSAAIQQELAQLLANGKNYLQLGAISESDMALIKSLGADPAAIGNVLDKTVTKLRNWRRGIVDDSSTRIQQYTPGQVDVGGTYGSEPEKPKAKSSDEFFGEMTGGDAIAPAVDETVTQRASDGSATHTQTRTVYKVPSRDETRSQVKGMKESAMREGLSDEDITKKLYDAKRNILDKSAQMEGRAKDYDKEEAVAKKKGDKKAEAAARKQASAARSAAYDYTAQIKPIQEEINALESGTAKADRDAKAKKSATKAANEVRRETVGKNF